ncbi:hypothetical protein NA56DRAFT_710211 [Hyaloscypha hepaticicola]|uniref:Retrovirus-related Pol polyprotein from transposon TNT 1-94-like beta-barrel domain-containing protein n=1 Tax=Hyaloscypha hepaticicola TaxID=2082293 RepID=A0A2J6PLS6_9HELO|nr:hypothetical protein NA56DRAFT_710211 [Hyaloscypha hepaticicola]
MSEDTKSSGGLSLAMVPILDGGSNWSDFHRRIEEYLTMSGLSSTMDPGKEPTYPNEPIAPASNALCKQAYDHETAVWNEKQARGCMAIRNRCGYNEYIKVQDKTRVYEMLTVLRPAERRDVTELSGTLSKINNELRDLHSTAAFQTVQLVLRFLQALGSGYEIFITTFQQTHNLIESPGNPAVTFDIKEFEENRKKRDRKRKSKSDSDGTGNSKKSRTSDSSNTTTSSSLVVEDGPEVGALIYNFNCLAFDEPTVLRTDTALSTAHTALQGEWIIDTGYTNHATGTLSHFLDIKYGDFSTYSGISGPVKYTGKGTVQIPVPGPNGHPTTLTLTDVKYCPSMGPFNLISVSQLYKGKKARPVISENSISWLINGHRINSTARHGLWLLDRTD